MKISKPIHLLLGGSSILFVITLLITFILDYQFLNIPFWVIVGLPLITSLISFGVNYFFIKHFIHDRLKLLYRNIRKGKISPAKDIKFKITDDVIASAELETQQWTEERNIEIAKLKEQEAFRREFLGNLAHELKTPIFSIQGYILTLLEGGLEDENVNVKFLQRAEKATERMVKMIEDLDQITKLEADALQLDLRNFDIVELVNELFESLEAIAISKNISLSLDKNYGSIPVFADRPKINQVLTNLVTNSILYGSVEGRTKIRFYEMDNIITVEVSDDGPGIEEKHFSRLFERFYRIEKSRNRNDGGSGLGLAIVKHILESHNQSIHLRSTVGVGSTFTFTLQKGR